jgi:glycine/D-amino acid oxidase-like deaminating enzyme
MKLDCLIIGQGICGTFLSWELEKAGLSYLVLDEPNQDSASKTAAGIINPVTGRRIVKTWMIDELLPFTLNAYTEIGVSLGINCISPKKIIDFFPSPQMRLAFLQRYEEDKEYLQMPSDENAWLPHFHFPFGYGEILSCWLVDLNNLLQASRKMLMDRGSLREEKFRIDQLSIGEDEITYKDIRAEKIIFCDGINGTHNPLFNALPFAPNKGEALIVEIIGLPPSHIYKKGISIVPWKENLFWVGSSYEWEFKNALPTPAFRIKTALALKEWVKQPFNILDHLVSIRPATLERRPFIGFHPVKKNVGIFNGMGTKGCSLAPYFAKQLAEHMIRQSDILPEADIKRFNNILSRSALPR